MTYEQMDREAVLKALESQKEGLSLEEAQRRRQKYGPNRLEAAKKTPLPLKFLLQMKDPMVLVLLAAVLISGITAIISGESFAESLIILFVVLMNAGLGVFQENKAEKAIEALQRMSAATSKVLRAGQQEMIKSEDLVIGDVVVLEAGDRVPADGRVLSSFSLMAEESALTGESVAVDKKVDPLSKEEGQIPLGDRNNMLYMGSSISYGRGHMVISHTGMDTEMGKIAGAIDQAKKKETPLQIKLKELSKILSVGVLIICLIIFIISTIQIYPNLHLDNMLSVFMIAVSLAVAAIPEGLSAVVTIVLSIGVTKMSQKKAIILKLTAVETLGCTQIICSDKTGTLTKNEMEIQETLTQDEPLFVKALSLCSDAFINADDEKEGEATEAALVSYAFSKGFDKRKEEPEYERVFEAPFDSDRKMMSTGHLLKEGGFIQYTKGAPDIILSRCSHFWDGKAEIPLTEEKKKEILGTNKKMADKALRVLGAAFALYETLPPEPSPEKLEQNLVFLGLAGMHDPIRPEVKDAILACQRAGIRPVMITGDHRDTAVAIAKALGIIKEEAEAITGDELDQISETDFLTQVSSYSVYARVQPAHKVRIVKGWQAQNKVVAMTGDGVNDAPAIKTADIGVGMGITGTDVTKNVADMVLSDDNFATIVSAVEEGRRIYENIRKTIQFLLASNLSEVVAIFSATLMGFVILKPVHLVWINLITDSFPAIALGMEKKEEDVMENPPRDRKESIFARGLGTDVLWQGVMVAILTVSAYFVGHYLEHGVFFGGQSEGGMTMAFITLSFAEMFHCLNMRSRTRSIFKMKTHNPYLFLAMGLSFVLTTGVVLVPGLRGAFQFAVVTKPMYFISLGLSFLILPLVEIQKWIHRQRKK